MKKQVLWFFGAPAALLLGCLAASLAAAPARAQARSTDESGFRGNRAEISVTLRDTSGAVITTAATIRLYHSGSLAGQAAANKGKAFFILNDLGDYTISVDATGYKSAQKDVSFSMAMDDIEDIVLAHDTGAVDTSGAPGRPILAPKANEALQKGLKALGENKLDEAQKALDEAMQLAPGHPDVLYAQGVLYLKKSEWDKAQGVLAQAAQVDPNNAHILTALGMAYVDAGKYDAAIAPLEQSIKANPSGWETHYTLAKAYYHHEQYPEALRESQNAVDQAKGAAPETELLLAQCLVAGGKFEDAAKILRGFLKNHPKDPGATSAKRWLDRLTADGKIHS